MGLSREIARFAVGTPAAGIPASARDVMALSMLDWLAVAMAGQEEPVSRIVRNRIRSEGGTPESSVLGETEHYPARAAALANGVASHALDYDDTHFDYIGHPSTVIVSAALAVAERIDSPGRDFLDAALIGAECACRIGAWLGRNHYQQGFHQTATSGCFGAALACARLLGLRSEQAEQAIGIASTRSAGLKSQFGTMGKPYNAGVAASSGVECALLAADGFTSARNALECDQGFAASHAGEFRDTRTVLGGLGKIYRFESVQHKFHACCHGIHASLEALSELLTRNDLSPGQIEAVSVAVNPRWLKVCDLKAPGTGLEAKFSYRLAVAIAVLGRDTAAPGSFSDEACRSPELIEMRDRVRVFPDEALADTAAEVEIRTRAGNVHGWHHDLARLPGLPVRTERVRAKAASLVGDGDARRLWDLVRSLPETRIREFVQHAGVADRPAAVLPAAAR